MYVTPITLKNREIRRFFRSLYNFVGDTRFSTYIPICSGEEKFAHRYVGRIGRAICMIFFSACHLNIDLEKPNNEAELPRNVLF